MRKLLAVVVTLGVVYLGAGPASASENFSGRVENCSECWLAFRFNPINDPGTRVRTIRVALTWTELNSQLVAVLRCGAGSSASFYELARSHGDDNFLSMTVGVPNFYPRCEVWFVVFRGPSTDFVMNIYGRRARQGTFLGPAERALRTLELSEEIERMRLDANAFTEPADDR